MSERRESAGATSPVMKEILLFLLRFLGASIAFYALYELAGSVYIRLLGLAAKPALALLGYEFVVEKALKIKEDLAINPGVFLSLVIAARHIPWRARIRPAVIGVAILTIVNALTLTLVFVSSYRGSEALWMGSEFLGLTINFFLPIVLWLVLLPIRQAFPFFTIKRG